MKRTTETLEEEEEEGKKNRILLWLWLDCLLFLLAKVSVFMEVITRDYIEELDGGTEALRS